MAGFEIGLTQTIAAMGLRIDVFLGELDLISAVNDSCSVWGI
jgi:hypothetical protein